MAMSKYVTAAAVGVLGLSTGVLGNARIDDFRANAGRGRSGGGGDDGREVFSSSARCSVVSIADASVTVEDRRAEAAVSAAAFVCADEGNANAMAAASATASAFAEAVAEVSAQCVTSGNAQATAAGSAAAKAEATVWLEAYAEAFATALTCGETCTAYTESFAFISQEVFLSAYAATEARIDAYSNSPGEKVQEVFSVKVDIEEAIVTAYAEALASVAVVKDKQNCLAYGNSEGCIVTEEDVLCASCEVTSLGASAATEIDAIAVASADATALACGPVAITTASAKSVAVAIATAHAEAVALVFADCQADEGGFACAEAGAFVEEAAFAVAFAFAESWATAVTCDGCFVQVDKVSEEIAGILVEASAEAFTSLCAVDGEEWSSLDFEQHIVTGHAVAVAAAVAKALAVTGPGFCLAAAGAGAGTAVV